MKRPIAVLMGVMLVGIALDASASVTLFQRSSEVSTVVQFLDPLYEYEYTVHNTSIAGPSGDDRQMWVTPTIVDYEVPLGGAGYAFNIQSPWGWLHELLSASEYEARFGVPNPYGSPYILHWYTEIVDYVEVILPMNPIYPGESLSGFILQSYRGPIDGPYLTSWWDEERNIGDPPLPGGLPVFGGTVPFRPAQGVIPEPASMLLVAGGVGALAVRLRNRRT